jgi:acyl-CoA reductase-like NAD-dependent aldehyde dehydrogenase
MRRYRMLIDGREIDTAEHDEVVDPSRGAPFALCPRATPAHVEQACAAAARALPAWREDEAARRHALGEAAAELRARADEIGRLLCAEHGKPLGAAVAEVGAAARWLAYYADLELEPEELEDDAQKRVMVRRRPLGVTAVVTPWSAPLVSLAGKLGPALRAGNTVVAKPSSHAPLSTLLVAGALAGVLPPGVFSAVAGGADIGEELVANPLVRKIAFTGRVATGKRVMRAAAADLKRLTLELGGNDPAIVLPDVDLAEVVPRLFWAAFADGGQVCMAIKRLYVHERVHDELVAALVEMARRVKVGPGLEPGTEIGPVNNQPELERVMAMVEDARARGATVAVGGERLPGAGYFYPPTVVVGARAGMSLVDEEQFGPALPVIRFDDVEDVLGQVNRTPYGLGGSVWSDDVERAVDLAGRLECGTAWVNHHQDVAPFIPFGGVKQSGIGLENGVAGLFEFTSLQVLNVRSET